MDQTLIDLGNEIFNSIKNIFPEHAEFACKSKFDTKNYAMRIDWELRNNPTHPNKPSKIILIELTTEALKDYQTLSQENKQKAQERLYNIIAKNFKNFTPEHEMSINETPPIEIWLITTKSLNGLS